MLLFAVCVYRGRYLYSFEMLTPMQGLRAIPELCARGAGCWRQGWVATSGSLGVRACSEAESACAARVRAAEPARSVRGARGTWFSKAVPWARVWGGGSPRKGDRRGSFCRLLMVRNR